MRDSVDSAKDDGGGGTGREHRDKAAELAAVFAQRAAEQFSKADALASLRRDSEPTYTAEQVAAWLEIRMEAVRHCQEACDDTEDRQRWDDVALYLAILAASVRNGALEATK